MSNARESKKETGKGGKILVTSNEGKSMKKKGKGDKISLKSKWRMNERKQDISDRVAKNEARSSKAKKASTSNGKEKVSGYLQI